MGRRRTTLLMDQIHHSNYRLPLLLTYYGICFLQVMDRYSRSTSMGGSVSLCITCSARKNLLAILCASIPVV